MNKYIGDSNAWSKPSEIQMFASIKVVGVGGAADQQLIVWAGRPNWCWIHCDEHRIQALHNSKVDVKISPRNQYD